LGGFREFDVVMESVPLENLDLFVAVDCEIPADATDEWDPLVERNDGAKASLIRRNFLPAEWLPTRRMNAALTPVRE
jgi:hypothetical protein